MEMEVRGKDGRIEIKWSLSKDTSSWSFLTSLANTTSAGATESIQLALIDITKYPSVLRKYCALSANIPMLVKSLTKKRWRQKTSKITFPFYGKLREGAKRIWAWSGWATSANKTSTMPTSILYLWGCLASSMMGMMLVRFLATLIRSRPVLWLNSTAYTTPVCMR